MLKRVLSVMLAVTLLFSIAAVAHAEDAPAQAAENRLYFDASTTGWKDYVYIGFHIWAIDDDGFAGFDWASKKQRGKQDENGIWYYDLDAAGLTLDPECQYAVIFYNSNGQQTYNLLFDSTCIGDVAYADPENLLENPEDSSKKALPAYWTNQAPEDNGPEMKITSIGNVVGECIPRSSSVYNMFTNFLINALDNARIFSGRDDQTIIDGIGEALGLTKEDVIDALVACDVEADWNYYKSTLPSDDDMTYPDDTNFYFDAKSAGWDDAAYIGFHLTDYYGNDVAEWGSAGERGTDGDGDGVWAYDISPIFDECANKEEIFYGTVVFYDDKGNRTYDLLYYEYCIGDTAYVKDGVSYASPADGKLLPASYWKDLDPEDFGPVLYINSRGELVGECYRYSSNPYRLLSDFIENDLETALELTGKSAQEMLDSLGAQLDLTREDIAYILKNLCDYEDISVDWDAEKSTLPGRYDDYDGVVVQTEDDEIYLEQGETFVCDMVVLSTRTIGSLEGSIEFDTDALELVGASGLSDKFFDVEFTPSVEGGSPLYFSAELKDGADYSDDEDTYSFDDEDEKLSSMMGRDLFEFKFKVTAESGVYPINTVCTAAADNTGKAIDVTDWKEFLPIAILYYDFDELSENWADYDGDGDVTIMDATRSQRILAELDERPDEDFLIEVDADLDGELTVMDATRIQRVIAGLCDPWGDPVDDDEGDEYEPDEYELPLVHA